MKKPRWRKIIKVTRIHASTLMNTYYRHEYAHAVWYGGGILSQKEEMALLNTLNEYANIIDRTIKIEPHLLGKEWISEVLNFGD